MTKIYEKEAIIDYLIDHVKSIGRIKNHILREFYKEQKEERYKFENILDEYIYNIMNIQNNADNLSKSWPLVLIGSIVEVENLGYNETEFLKIVPPFYQDKGNNIDCASCLSPIGKALLLKKIGDKITVNTPLGDSNLIIKSIELSTI